MLAGEAGRLSMLIENVLDLGRVERGERAYDLRRLDVGELVRETLACSRRSAQQAGRWSSVELPEARRAQGSIARVRAGAVAVLDNARKYGLAAVRIDVLVAQRRDSLVIEVRDRGPGVPAASANASSSASCAAQHPRQHAGRRHRPLPRAHDRAAARRRTRRASRAR
jgi:K+-sensing histidine kinase KdpD